MMHGKWRWRWGYEFHYDNSDYYWKVYGLYIMGRTFIGYCKLVLVNGPGEEDGPWAEGWEERSGRSE